MSEMVSKTEFDKVVSGFEERLANLENKPQDTERPVTTLCEAVEDYLKHFDRYSAAAPERQVMRIALAREKQIVPARDAILEAFRAFAPMSGSEYHLQILNKYDDATKWLQRNTTPGGDE